MAYTKCILYRVRTSEFRLYLLRNPDLAECYYRDLGTSREREREKESVCV